VNVAMLKNLAGDSLVSRLANLVGVIGEILSSHRRQRLERRTDTDTSRLIDETLLEAENVGVSHIVNLKART
jgi:hypothetical protein